MLFPISGASMTDPHPEEHSSLLPVVIPLAELPVPTMPPDQVASLIEAWTAGRGPSTLRAYRADLADFASFCGEEDTITAAGQLLGRGLGEANALVLRYRGHLVDRKMAAATVNRRLAAIRSLVSLAKTIGLVPWELAVPGIRSQPYRDTKGPGRAGVKKMLAVSEARSDPKGARDRAAFRLMYDLGLRRGEVCSLNLGDVDIASGRLAVLGKGRAEKEFISLPPKTIAVLAAWITVRPSTSGTAPESPLFVCLDRSGKVTRLTGSGLYKVVRIIGGKCGIKGARPHGIRHTAITDCLTAARGDVTEARKFSRHKNINTLVIYDDRRTDGAFELAKKVSDNV